VVLRASDVAQVGDAIVGFFVVDVVELALRPRPVNVKPRQSVRSIYPAVDAYARIANAFFYATGLIFVACAAMFASDPAEKTGVRVVVQ
jgi:hypothetical protein